MASETIVITIQIYQEIPDPDDYFLPMDNRLFWKGLDRLISPESYRAMVRRGIESLDEGRLGLKGKPGLIRVKSNKQLFSPRRAA